nr:hypothetical protein [uncultured Pseudodesulfovibrio sp.]
MEVGFQWTIFGSIVGAIVASLVVNFAVGKVQLERTTKQIRLREWEKKVDLEREERLFFVDKLERAYVICSSLSYFNSMTKWFIESERMCSPEEWDQLYQIERAKFDELEMLIGLYFQDLVDVCNKLHGATNCFWGNQRSYMRYEQDGKKDLQEFYGEKIVKDSQTVGQIVSSLEYGLSRHAKGLGFNVAD